MNEFSKLLHYSPSDASYSNDEATDHEEDVMLDDDLSTLDKARVQFFINALEVKHFCDDIAYGIDAYREQVNSKLSRKRQLNLNSLEDIISEPKLHATKEACMMLIKEQLDKMKTGFLMFKGKSRLRSIMLDIIATHSSSQLKRAREDLMHEMCAHRKLIKKYNAIKGEDLEQLKHDLAAAHSEIEDFKSREYSGVSSQELASDKFTVSTSFIDRFTGIFRK